jgi:hypothetical protein
MMAKGVEGEGDEIPFETGRLISNWAGTFECLTERYYTPNTEAEVVEVTACLCCVDFRL